AAVVPTDEHNIRLRLCDAGGDSPDSDFGDQLYADARSRVRVLQVMDELGEVLDRVDVVVGRWADEANAGSGVANLGDPRIDLGAGQLAAFAGLGALGHLDLELVGVDQVLARDAETARCHLFNRTAAEVSVCVGSEAAAVFAALAGVASAADAVHRDGER